MTTWFFPARSRAAAVALALAAATLGVAAVAQQQPAFRENVDVIEFDVRVVTANGTPVVGLGPDKFEVSIDGGHRRVISADLVDYSADAPLRPLATSNARGIWPEPKSLRLHQSGTRVYLLVIDASTFDSQSAAGTLQAARSFVGRLTSDDMVGLFVFPTGAQLSPTTDRGKVMAAIQRVSATSATPPQNRLRDLNLRPSEIVALTPDLSVPDGIPQQPFTSEKDQLILHFCPLPPSLTYSQAVADESYLDCTRNLQTEVANLIEHHERQALQSLSFLRTLILNLADVEGRKTLLLMSGGLFTSNRPGGRPNAGGLPMLIGQDAIKTNISIYTIYNDWHASQRFSAEQRLAPNTLHGILADSTLYSDALSDFTGASGGAFFKTITGSGEGFFDQILRETSAYYVLGVVPEARDRDGRPRQLSVKVRQSGVTVRGSRWVTVPPRQ